MKRIYITFRNHAKTDIKVFGHVQLYFVPNILSNILDGPINFDATCSVDMHTVSIPDTKTL